MTEQTLRGILSANIRRYRGYRKWSQEQLAERIDISVPFLSDIENGRKWVSPGTLVKFASAFNIEPFELFLPEASLPAPLARLLAKYTDEAILTISRSLKDMQAYYTAQTQAEAESPGGT